MTTGQALSMEESAEKLRNLREHMEKSDDFFCAFGEYLASHLNPRLIPIGFVMACEQALYDVQEGVDSRTNEGISTRVAGYPPLMYALLRMRLPEMMDAVLPAEFSAQAKAFMEEVEAKARATA